MDQYLNNRQHEILWKLLANPADKGHAYASELQSLVNEFPQSGLLHALLTRADKGQTISNASAYADPKTLYKIINAPGYLLPVSMEQIVQGSDNNVQYIVKEIAGIDTDKPVTIIAEDEIAEVQSIDHLIGDQGEPETKAVVGGFEPLSEDDLLIEQAAEPAPGDIIELPADEHHPVTAAPVRGDTEDMEPITITAENVHFYENELVTEAGAAEQDQAGAAILAGEEPEAIDDEKEEAELPIAIIDINPVESELITDIIYEEVQAPRDIDDDVYDEIVGIDDINFTPIAKPSVENPQAEEIFHEEELPEPAFAEETLNRDRPLNLDDEAEKLMVGNIAATDYFAFDRAVGDRKQTETPDKNPAPAEGPVNEGLALTEKQPISKYNDDKMPYTFMWWLDKTRKEHAGIYQPFKPDVSQSVKQSGAEELQQQYYENIFHLNSVEELDSGTHQPTVQFDMKTKEDRIIKRFIVEEPHIKPPSGDKLDNENKAKKSAEDQDEMVTETLARIYTDQMLYHKAINTYKKLILKFPEKSRYFADQIEQLERKTN